MKDLEAANEVFVERVRAGNLREASLLKVLLFETQTLVESALISYQLEHSPIGGVLLDSYQIKPDLIHMFGIDNCLATWTIPFDLVEDTYFLASAYHLSDFVRQFWEEKTEGRIEWFACNFGELESAFEKLELAAVQPPVTAPA